MSFVVYGANSEGVARPTPGRQAHSEGGTTTQATGAAAHAEGSGSLASGSVSHAEGAGTVASGSNSHAEGTSTTASATSARADGTSSIASADNAWASGYQSKATRFNQFARGAPLSTGMTIAQYSDFPMVATTSGTSSQTLKFLESNVLLTGASTNVFTIDFRTVIHFRADIVGRRTDTQGQMATFTVTGAAGRDSTGSARILGSAVIQTWADAAANTWTVAASINTTDATNNYLLITVTGGTSATVQWVASLHVTELQTSS